MRQLRACRLIAAVACAGMFAMPTGSFAMTPARLAQVPSVPADVFPIGGSDFRSPEGGPDGLPASRTDMWVVDVAAAVDGSLLVADAYGQVRRIGLDNIVTDVAGSNPFRQRPSDTAALRAEIGQPVAVAGLSDGGFLVSGSGVQRVWPDQSVTTLWRGDAEHLAVLPDGRVLASGSNSAAITQINAEGRVSRFAGMERGGFSGDGGPATRARLSSPVAMAPMPDGSVLIADTGNNRVRRVDSRGFIDTATRIGFPQDVAAAPDGGFYVSNSRSIRRYSAGGSLVQVYSTRAFGWTAPYGRRDLYPDNLAVLPDGNLAFTSTERLWIMPVAPMERLAVSLRNLLVAGDTVTTTFATTAAGTATLTTQARNGPVSITAPVAQGINQLSLAGPFASKARPVQIEIADATGRIADDRIDSWLGQKLRMADARNLIQRSFGDAGETFELKACRRFSPRRVDCVVHSFDIPGRACSHVASIRLRATGMPQQRSYRCRKGKSPFRQ